MSEPAFIIKNLNKSYGYIKAVNNLDSPHDLIAGEIIFAGTKGGLFALITG